MEIEHLCIKYEMKKSVYFKSKINSHKTLKMWKCMPLWWWHYMYLLSHHHEDNLLNKGIIAYGLRVKNSL